MARPVAVDPHDRRSPSQRHTSPSHQLIRTPGEKQRPRSYKPPGQTVNTADSARTMSGALMLRGLAESFVVSPPSGVTIKTRLRPTPAEEQVLREEGTFLGPLYRADLVRRLGEGKLDAQGRAASRRERKRGLTSASSSRWAGSITRATQDQYDLAAGALAAEGALPVPGAGKLAQRIAAPVGGRVAKIAGYRSAGERHGKTRRLAQLTSRLGGCRHHAGVGAAERGPGRQTALADPEQPGAGKPERPGVGDAVDPPADVPERRRRVRETVRERNHPR